MQRHLKTNVPLKQITITSAWWLKKNYGSSILAYNTTYTRIMLISSLIDPGASTLKSIKKVTTVGTALLIVSHS